MSYIDPHIHMISRITDDYQRMAQCGCIALSEPAFWAGFDRGSAEGFRDYFRHLTEIEPKRAAQFGIRHYSWLCINAKEAENVALSREVIAVIPEFLDRPNVLGIREMVGTDRIMANSAGDWGKSNPLAVPEMIQEMKRRGHGEEAIRKVVYENPLAFFRQSVRWQEPALAGTVQQQVKAMPRGD